MQVIEIDFQKINSQLGERKNIIYGAGYNGKLLFEMLQEKNISVEAFYDDDVCRQGSIYCGKNIITQQQLLSYNTLDVNIIISSMYIGQILLKIERLGLVHVYTVIEKLLEKDTLDFQFEKYKNNKPILNKLDKLIQCSNDQLTKRYFDTIRKTINSGKAIRDIVDLYQGEKQYFLDTFKGKLDGLVFLDAGAYTGDTVRELLSEKIDVKKIYCFEADKENFIKLEKFCNENLPYERYSCINAALWDEKKYLAMKFNNYNARVDEEGTELTVKTVTIDDFFSEEHVNFVKMDIEGAEKRALKGGMKTIKRDRPIMAISIYHGVEDIVDIPIMLMEELENYDFLVRHHSYTYSETVLYCIPQEWQ